MAVNEPWADYLRRVMRAAEFEPDGVRTGGRTELAKAAQVSLSAISRSLNEGRTPDPMTLRALAGPLNVTYLDLLLAAGYLTEDELAHPKNAHNRAMERYARQRATEESVGADTQDEASEDELVFRLRVPHEATPQQREMARRAAEASARAVLATLDDEEQ